MNHQPYLEWIFSDGEIGLDRLNQQQRYEFDQHLNSCSSCRSLFSAWHATEVYLQNQSLISPKPGFTSRWKLRLEEDRKLFHRRQTKVTLAVSIGGSLLLLVLLFLLTWPWLRSPSLLVWTWIYHIFFLYSYVGLVNEIIVRVIQSATFVIPITWLIILIGILSELGVLWIVSYRLLTNPRRITR